MVINHTNLDRDGNQPHKPRQMVINHTNLDRDGNQSLKPRQRWYIYTYLV